jgi:sugar lactone lactonase YvrE
MTRIIRGARPVVECTNELGEGPLWDEERRQVVWVDILAGEVHRHDLTTGAHRVTQEGRAVSAVVPRAGGGLALMTAQGVLLRAPGGDDELLLPVEEEIAGNRLGDAAADPQGRLWVGSLDADLAPGKGTLYRWAVGEPLVPALRPVSVSNGIGWSPDGKVMYYIDSATRRVDAWDFDPETGLPANRCTLATIEDADGLPDGLAVDDEGGVWVALWLGGQVRRYLPDGTLDTVVPLPVRRVTSCAFGGEDLTTLFITTARVEMTERELEAEPLAGALFAVQTEVRGLPPGRIAH